MVNQITKLELEISQRFINNLLVFFIIADDFYKRVKGIALTDSVHSSGMVPTHSRHWFQKKAFNWIKSDLPINEPIREADSYYGCNCFSAGEESILHLFYNNCSNK